MLSHQEFKELEVIKIPYNLGSQQICPDILHDHSSCSSDKCSIYQTKIINNIPIINQSELHKLFTTLFPKIITSLTITTPTKAITTPTKAITTPTKTTTPTTPTIPTITTPAITTPTTSATTSLATASTITTPAITTPTTSAIISPATISSAMISQLITPSKISLATKSPLITTPATISKSSAK